MQTITRSFNAVGITIGIIICLAQAIYFVMLHNKIDIIVFLLLYFPLIILLIFWGFHKKIEFYQYWIYVYLGFFCFIFIYSMCNYFNNINDTSGDFPPGETNFDLFMFLAIYTSLQAIILLLLNVSTYVVYKIFSKK